MLDRAGVHSGTTLLPMDTVHMYGGVLPSNIGDIKHLSTEMVVTYYFPVILSMYYHEDIIF